MRRSSPYTPDQRARAERLVCETARPMSAVAAELGIRYATLCRWAAAGGWRGSDPPPGRTAPSDWPPARRAALVRIACAPGVARQDLARALGVGRTDAAAFFKALDLPVRRRAGTAPLNPAATDGPALRAALRGHVARQIAAFDAALARGGPGMADSARVLRDLGGLKRLLDELALPREDGDADADDADDLPALRAELARQLDRQLGGQLGEDGRSGSGPCAEHPAGPGPAGAGA